MGQGSQKNMAVDSQCHGMQEFTKLVYAMKYPNLPSLCKPLLLKSLLHLASLPLHVLELLPERVAVLLIETSIF